MKKRAALHNLGCKVNAYETEAMRQLLEEDGYEIVPFEPGADVYVINTCTVTNIADRKSRQMLHKARKMNPDAIVVAAGCYVETADGGVEKDPAIDIILGNNQKNQLVSVIRDFEQKRAGKRAEEPSGVMTKKIDINHTKEYENLIIDRTENRTRADIKVQDGCNQFCTYCIIPFARGRVRSRKPEEPRYAGCSAGGTRTCSKRMPGDRADRYPFKFLRRGSGRRYGSDGINRGSA